MSPIPQVTYEFYCREMIRLVEKILPIKKWGFHESARFPQSSYATVIYDSQWCRMRFMWDGIVRPPDTESMWIYYGRLHAPNNENNFDWGKMIWLGEKYQCWHDIKDGLKFLDGLSPDEAHEKQYQLPRVMDEFVQSDEAKNIEGHPEWVARIHAHVWKYYGQRLFELFSVRRPSLWDQYLHFLGEIQRLDDEERKRKGQQSYVEVYGTKRDKIR